MIVSCPNCSTRFTIPGAAIPATGRAVRCSKCGTKWRQGQPPDEVTGLTTAGEAVAALKKVETPAPEPEPAESEATETETAEADTPPWSAKEESRTEESGGGPSLLDIDVTPEEPAEDRGTDSGALVSYSDDVEAAWVKHPLWLLSWGGCIYWQEAQPAGALL